MPLGGIGTTSINNMKRQKSSEAIRAARADVVEVENSKLNDKINMEAY